MGIQNITYVIMTTVVIVSSPYLKSTAGNSSLTGSNQAKRNIGLDLDLSINANWSRGQSEEFIQDLGLDLDANRNQTHSKELMLDLYHLTRSSEESNTSAANENLGGVLDWLLGRMPPTTLAELEDKKNDFQERLRRLGGVKIDFYLEDLLKSTRIPPLWRKFLHRYQLSYIRHTRDRRSLTTERTSRKPRDVSKSQTEQSRGAYIASLFHEMSTRCLPISHSSAIMGYYRITQYNSFALKCAEGKIRPLNTMDMWNCDPLTFLQGFTVASLCVDVQLPLLVSMTAEVALIGLVNSGCGSYADLRGLAAQWKEHIKGSRTTHVARRKFSFRPTIGDGRCYGSFKSRNNFQVEVKISFTMEHIPTEEKLPPRACATVASHITKVIQTFLESQKVKNKISDYVLPAKKDLVFKAEGCSENGRAIETLANSFCDKPVIPPCRPCDRGLYLNKETGECYRCVRGWYSDAGATECKECPLKDDSMSSADSLRDCYAVKQCEACQTSLLVESITILAIYHLLCLIVAAWNLRHTLPTGRLGSTVDDRSNKGSLSTKDKRSGQYSGYGHSSRGGSLGP